MQVMCPACSASYFVDVEKIPMDGGQLTCPTCAVTWDIYRPGADRRSKPRAEPKRAAPLPPPLSCPKCGHRFRPGVGSRDAEQAADRKVILLVEDQTYFTELAKEALGTSYQTITVATQGEALKVIGRGLPNLMILDLSLAQGQDGTDLLKAMPKKRFPVLIFTAKDESELYGDAWAELQALGADDIVHKTMNAAEELRRKVGEMLDE